MKKPLVSVLGLFFISGLQTVILTKVEINPVTGLQVQILTKLVIKNSGNQPIELCVDKNEGYEVGGRLSKLRETPKFPPLSKFRMINKNQTVEFEIEGGYSSTQASFPGEQLFLFMKDKDKGDRWFLLSPMVMQGSLRVREFTGGAAGPFSDVPIKNGTAKLEISLPYFAPF